MLLDSTDIPHPPLEAVPTGCGSDVSAVIDIPAGWEATDEPVRS